jgi:hypothetical protein
VCVAAKLLYQDSGGSIWAVRNAKGEFVGGHAAVLLSVEPNGSLHVLDQFNSRGKVDKSFIQDKPDDSKPYISHDASNYRVIFY